MRETIIENLHETLGKPIDKERVVYVMVEIRKFIKRREGEDEQWKTLKYWCDWTLHAYLDRNFAKQVLERMEDYIQAHPDHKFHHSEFNRTFVSLEALRGELYQFLKTNGLPEEITNIPPWDEFSRCLLETLKDCPLVKDDGSLREFAFTKTDHVPELQKYSIDWVLKFSDRGELTGSVLRSEEIMKAGAEIHEIGN